MDWNSIRFLERRVVCWLCLCWTEFNSVSSTACSFLVVFVPDRAPILGYFGFGFGFGGMEVGRMGNESCFLISN